MLVAFVLEIPVIVAFFDWRRRSPDSFLGGQSGKDKWGRRLVVGLLTSWFGVGIAVSVWYLLMVVRADTDGEPQVVSASESVFIQASPEQCLAVVIDVESYLQWSPGVTEAAVVSQDSNGRPTEATFVRDAPMGGGSFSYTMTFAYSEPNGIEMKMVNAQTDDPEKMEMLNQMMGGMSTKYRFDANGEETLMNFELCLALPPQIPAMIASRMPGMMASKTTTELKDRIEHLVKVG